MENKHGKTIKRIRSDNGREYTSEKFENFLKENGITQLSSPYNPQQNGVAERINRTLVELAKYFLIEIGLPTLF